MLHRGKRLSQPPLSMARIVYQVFPVVMINQFAAKKSKQSRRSTCEGSVKRKRRIKSIANVTKRKLGPIMSKKKLLESKPYKKLKPN